MTTYYKITNREENHNGFQYRDGLNVLKEPFNDDPTASCVAGGLYFTTKEYIHKFYSYGINVRVVKLPVTVKADLGCKPKSGLPTDDPDFKIVKDPQGDKWRANKIILCEKYSLLDPATYELWGSDITENKNLIDYASANGHVDILQWWLKSGLKLEYTKKAMNWASENGHVNVLEWWIKSGLKLEYTIDAMDWASRKGYVNVLDWWLKSGLELRYTENATKWALMYSHTNVLVWWKKSGLELKYTIPAIKEMIGKL